MPPFLKTQRLAMLPTMEKKVYEIHGKEEGSVLTVDFEIEEQKFVALNGWPDIQIQRSHFVSGTLRDARRSGLLLGETFRGWRRKGAAVRLAQGQIRSLMANRSYSLNQDAERQRY